jgi:geranylgeranyl reductase family protein
MIAVPAIDVLVIGLGPAGACAAAAAARAGARVVAIDRRTRAGEPVQCAELVPAPLAGEVALDAVAQQPIRRMLTMLDGAAHETVPFAGWMIDRARFDAALVAVARDAGACVRFGTAVRAIARDGRVTLASGESIAVHVIVGADGPRSLVGRAIGAANPALVETRQITVPLRRAHDGTDVFLDAALPGGYAWLFPRGRVANLGVGAIPAARRQLKPILARLHARLVAAGRVGDTILATTGGAIPVGGPVGPIGRLGATAVLLAGDAAGLANPVTGAGIAAAVMSGRLAGAAAASGAIAGYAEALADLFGGALTRALERRHALLRRTADGVPDAAALRRAWIAYPEYWAA